MTWTERQRAMLKEMGVPYVWPTMRLNAPAQPPSCEPQATVAALATTRPASPPGPAHPPPAPEPSASAATLAPRPREMAPVLASMDMEQLRTAIAACQACALCQSRRNTVPGIGNLQAHWMIVGEAPGEQEDAAGEPFVGKAGQLLDQMLKAIALTREPASAPEQVFIANVLKCRPPGNRNPNPEEVAQCEPFLQRQVALVRPRIILALGRFAAQSLLSTTEPIGRLRGRVHRYADTPVIVTYHPAYLLRNPADKALVWSDLCLAYATLKQTAGGTI